MGRKHCMMYYAGYKYLNYNRKTGNHRLLNLQTGDIEIWHSTSGKIGIPYKNTFLYFVDIEYNQFKWRRTTL